FSSAHCRTLWTARPAPIWYGFFISDSPFNAWKHCPEAIMPLGESRKSQRTTGQFLVTGGTGYMGSRLIPMRSGIEAIRTAKRAGIKHFIYVSVAHPAPAMHAYIAARTACEAELQ